MRRSAVAELLRFLQRRAGQSPFGFRGPSGGFFGGRRGGLAPYNGPVATRTSIPSNRFANSGSFTTRTYHVSRVAIPNIRVAWANAALLNPGGEASAGTLTTLGQVEYPAGNYTGLEWGLNSFTIAAAGALPVSNPAAVNIPANTGFWIEAQLTGSTYVQYGEGAQKVAALGDAFQTGGTDMNNVVDNNTAIIFPSLILGTTTQRTPLGVGDSRFNGVFDQTDAARQGNSGDFQQAFSPNYAGTRYGCVGLTAATFNGNNALALQLAAYHTDVVYELCINDIVAGTNAATLQALTLANIALFTALGKRVWLCLSYPANSSSNNWQDLAGQTPGANDAVRVTDNTSKRNGVYATAAGYYDYTGPVESSLNSGDWKSDGTAFKYTGPGGSGAHTNPFSTQLFGPFSVP